MMSPVATPSGVYRETVKLVEKNEADVSTSWKFVQVVVYVAIGVSAITASLSFTFLRDEFGVRHQCLLFSDIKLGSLDGLNVSLRVEGDDATKWGKASECDFSQFAPLVSFMGAFIWATFFLACGNGGSAPTHGLSEPWTIVFPAFVFSTSMVIVSLTNAVMTCQGLDAFCSSFIKALNASSCSEITNYNWTQITSFKVTDGFYSYLVLSDVSIWFVAVGWLVCTFALLTRFTDGFYSYLVLSDVSIWFVAVGWLVCTFALLARCLARPDFDAILLIEHPEESDPLVPGGGGGCVDGQGAGGDYLSDTDDGGGDERQKSLSQSGDYRMESSDFGPQRDLSDADLDDHRPLQITGLPGVGVSHRAAPSAPGAASSPSARPRPRRDAGGRRVTINEPRDTEDDRAPILGDTASPPASLSPSHSEDLSRPTVTALSEQKTTTSADIHQ